MNKRIAIIFLSTVLTSGAVFAKPGPNHGPRAHHSDLRPIIKQLQELDLNATQKEDIRLIIKTLQTDIKTQRPKALTNQQRDKSALDESEMIARVESRFEVTQDKKLKQAQARHAIYQLLDDGQRQQLLSQESKRGLTHREARDHTSKPELPFAFELLDLEASQRTELTALMQKKREQRLQYAETMKVLRLQERAIIYTQDFDQDAWLTLSQQFKQALIERQVHQIQHKKAIASVLTQTQLDELKSTLKRPFHGPRQPHS
tara:strand:+ start:34 stop:813 length:780 start_codon:yes stop_codon:yes gene_type:complete